MMPGLDLFLHDQLVGVVEPDRRNKTRVTLHMVEHLQWKVRRLLAGEVIGELKP